MMPVKWRLVMTFRTVLACLLWTLYVPPAVAEQKYEHPPQEILEVMNAPAPPVAISAPTGDAILLARPLYYPPISDLAEPLLRLAGVRVNPKNNGLHGSAY